MNLYILIGLLILLPLINAAMYPSPEEVVTINPDLLKEIEPVTIDTKTMTPAEKLKMENLFLML